MMQTLTRQPGPVNFVSFMTTGLYLPAHRSTYHIRTFAERFTSLLWVDGYAVGVRAGRTPNYL